MKGHRRLNTSPPALPDPPPRPGDAPHNAVTGKEVVWTGPTGCAQIPHLSKRNTSLAPAVKRAKMVC